MDNKQFTTSANYDHGRIKVIGVGGAGGNTINHMVEQGIHGVEIYAMNTDVQALNRSKAPHTLQIGELTTKGLGAGADPNIGLRSAQESRTKIKEILEDTDMLFITAGMGGGTGTGAVGVIAQEAKELNIVCVAVVSMPFSFEGHKRMNYARQGVQELQKHVNSLIIIPNDKLNDKLGPKVSLLDAFKASDDVLYGAINAMSSIITFPGHINVDFADVRTVMQSPGLAMIGTAQASGVERAKEAVDEALSCELLGDMNIENAKGLLVCVTANENIGLGEFAEIGDRVSEIAQSDAPVIIGTSIDQSMGDELKVTIVATGFEAQTYTSKHAGQGGRYTLSSPEKRKLDQLKSGYSTVEQYESVNRPSTHKSDIPVDVSHFLKKK